jgi:hypothetical protein
MQLVTLFEREAESQDNVLSERLSALYGGRLCFLHHEQRRPFIIGNFVQTLDGIVSWNLPGWSSGGAISGFNGEDRFIMALLRSCADAVMSGPLDLSIRTWNQTLWISGGISANLIADH